MQNFDYKEKNNIKEM